MKKHSYLVATLALAGALSANALTVTDYGAYTLSYDETTSFGGIAYNFNGSGGSTGFVWNVDTSVFVSSFGAATPAAFTLPDFTISANAGWALSGPVSGFLGNLVFNEVGPGATTTADASGMVSIDGGAATPFGGPLTKVNTTTVPGYIGGYFVGNGSVPTSGFSTFAFTGGSLALSAGGGIFSSVIGQSQNELRFSLVATPVPEPETAALLLAGLLAVGSLAHRRRPG